MALTSSLSIVSAPIRILLHYREIAFSTEREMESGGGGGGGFECIGEGVTD